MLEYRTEQNSWSIKSLTELLHGYDKLWITRKSIFLGDFDQLGFVFQDKYYLDKCLPFGASISCALFENFSFR
jgi:hypothetical protein